MVSIGSENAKNIQYCKPIFLSLIADLFHHFNQVSYSRMHENQTSAGMWHSRPPRDPPPFMAKTILNFHFDYWNPSLNLTICTFVLNSLKIQISHRASVLSLVHIVPAIRLGSLGKCPVCASRKVNLIAFLQIPSGSVRVGQIGLP